MKTRILFIVISLLLLTAFSHAQVVKGKVVDATTGNPVARASVYLKGSSKGTTSNAQGEFILNIDETKIPLVISYVGYQPDTIKIYNSKNLIVKLSPRDQVLREVVIGNVTMTREKQMKIFLTQFIGSRNKDCIITNPDDINFTYHKKTKTLEANADQPLIIYNKKLGYKITYFLSAFSYSPKQTFYYTETSPYHMETSYKGNYVFEEDTSGLTSAEIKKILKARDKAYYGSRMHFIRLVLAGINWRVLADQEKTKFSLWFNNLSFYHDEINFIFNNIRANKQQLLNNVIIHNDERYYSGRPMADITYNGIDRSRVTFQSGAITFKRQTDRADELPLNPNSYNESNLIWCGKMAEQRVSDLLPYDFEPMEPLSETD